MAKARTEYVCKSCGARATRWSGRCPGCEEWNTLEERVSRATAAVGVASRPRLAAAGGVARPVRLTEIDVADVDRLPVGIAELDRVLGGGIVPGSLVLVGGDPGVGKSTLFVQACDSAATAHGPVLYVSGEESLSQIGLRARRLGLGAKDLL